MKVKKYIVADMNEAMIMIRRELGRNAVIISQRKIRKKGVMGLFSKKLIEVTAAADENYESENKAKAIKDSLEIIRSAASKSKIKDTRRTVIKKPDTIHSDELVNEIKDMKKMITKLSSKEEPEGEDNEIINLLKDNDVDENIITKIMDKVILDKDDIDEKEKVKKVIKNMIRISRRKKSQGIMVLVGPTGVGKTTTVAKLAGKYSLLENKKVGLITIDTYRIGAVEQLKTYSDIMSIPFKVVVNAKEMENALNEMKDCEIIIIDTTGRNCKNVIQISELKAFIEKADTKNIHLVVSSTTKNKDVVKIIEGYKKLNFNNVIITKLDETVTFGSILNILSYAKKPLSFITTGQKVPDDIKCIDKDKICRLILGEDCI